MQKERVYRSEQVNHALAFGLADSAKSFANVFSICIDYRMRFHT